MGVLSRAWVPCLRLRKHVANCHPPIMTLEQQIKDKALQLGFDAVGITDASPIAPADVARFQTWLASGHAGQMQYMHRHLEKRFAPTALLDGTQSVIVAAISYKPVPDPRDASPRDGLLGRVAQYACYDDYHVIIKSLLHELASFVRAWVQEPLRFKVCVDSAPLAERALAVRAGLGFIGLNHTLIHPALGPQVFLGELVTTARLQADQPVTGGCSSCRRCIEACPAGALQDDGYLNARKCISYLTIEHKGDIDPDLAAGMGDHLFGCDECILACPFQEAAPARKNPALRYHPERVGLDLQEVLTLYQSSFETRFGDSPLCRTGLDSLKRNARICLQNGIQGR